MMRQQGEFWIDMDLATRDVRGNPTITLRTMTRWANPLGVEVARFNPSVYYAHQGLAEFIARAATESAKDKVEANKIDAAFRAILASTGTRHDHRRR